MEGKFDAKYFLTGGGTDTWWKAAGYGFRIFLIVLLVCLLIAGGFSIWRFIFPIPDKQINKPKVTALPFAKIGSIDQSNVQIQMEEKKWAVNIGGGQLRWDNRDGWIIGGFVTRKW